MNKGEDTEAADIYRILASQELDHAMKLHQLVVREINKYKDDSGEPPSDMLTLYNYLHGKYMEKYSEIKKML